MVGRVVHLDEKTHAELKRYAKANSTSMGGVVRRMWKMLEEQRLQPIAPVAKKKKKLEIVPDPVETDVMTRPPFWKGSEVISSGSRAS